MEYLHLDWTIKLIEWPSLNSLEKPRSTSSKLNRKFLLPISGLTL